MAIAFSKDLSTTNFLSSYNNNIVIFSSDNVLDSAKCTINISGNDFVITPINNIFRFNFKEVITVLINQSNFEDNIVPALNALDATSLVYNDTANTFINPLITFTITFSDSSTEVTTKTYKWLKSVEQLENNKDGVLILGGNVYALSPFKVDTVNTWDLVYYEGYPFDIPLLLNNTGVTTILNQTNANTYNFTLPNTVNRLFFSDGRINVTIGDFLPLVDGLNELKITNGVDIIYINVYKFESKEGQFIKYLNQYGGWSYWLFNCIYKKDNKVKDLGFVNNDFNDLDDTTSPTFGIGKDSQKTLTLISEGVEPEHQILLNQLFDSPKVYYFTGIRFSQVNDISWMAVNVKSASNNLVDYKNYFKDYKVQIELPKTNTMKL